MQKTILFPFRLLYTLYAVLLFLVIMFLALPFVIVASFFGRMKGGNMIYRICWLWGDIWTFLLGIRHKNIYEVPQDKSRQFIFVANHSSYMDVPILMEAIRQPVRVLAKSEMAKIPVFGYIYRNAVVMVDRSDAEQRARSVQVMKSVLRRGVSIFIFPEGTFNMGHSPLKEFYDGAFRIALETQTPIKPVIFADSLDLMHHSSIFTIRPGISRAIFLEEVPVEGLTRKDAVMLKEKVWKLMDEALRKYKPGYYK